MDTARSCRGSTQGCAVTIIVTYALQFSAYFHLLCLNNENTEQFHELKNDMQHVATLQVFTDV